MFKVMQIFSKESEDPKTNRWKNPRTIKHYGITVIDVGYTT